MNKTRKRSFSVLLFVLVSLFALVLSLGILSACGNEETLSADESANGSTWYYGDKEPAEGLGKNGDFYLNTETLASYVKEGKTWRVASEDETGVSWYYGPSAPQGTIGVEHDFYLNTKTGELYQKGAEDWGSAILTLQGQKGRDGVMWFSGEGDPNELEGSAKPVDPKAGDFYLDTKKFEVYQLQPDGTTWNLLGSIKGDPGDDALDPVQFYNGYGAPKDNADLLKDAKEGDLYLGRFLGSEEDSEGAGTRLYRYLKGKWEVLMESMNKNQLDIYTYEQLTAFAQTVSGGNDYAGKEVHLKTDINFNEIETASLHRALAARAAENWTPIGSSETPFRGTFDGEGHIIENFTVTASETGARVGFFGYVENATIEHLRFVNASVTAADEVTDVAGGVLAGEVKGKTTLTGVTVENSAVATESAAGGLVGKTAEESDLTVQGSSSEIVVEGGDKVSTEWSENNVGSEPDSTVFEIPSEDGLMAFAERVNSGDTFEGVTVVLTQDINLESANWTPIGTNAHPFKGIFMGGTVTDGKVVPTVRKISNMTIAKTGNEEGLADDDDKKFAAFFAFTQDAAISNLHFVKANVTNTYADNEGAAGYCAVLVGRTNGGKLEITNVTIGEEFENSKEGRATHALEAPYVTSGKAVAAFVSRSTGGGSITIENCINYANLCAPKAAGFIAQFQSDANVPLVIKNSANYGNITMPQSKDILCDNPHVVMGGFIGYIQNHDNFITLADCANHGDITIDITAHIGKFSVGGISGGGRSEHNYTNVVNNGNITVDDQETVESVQTENIIGEIGGLIGSASGTKHLKHVENNGNISVTTINQRNYGVGGLFGQGNSPILEVGANDADAHSIVKCSIEVKSTTGVAATTRVAGAVTGYDANAATKIENTDITVTISPLSASNLGLSGSGSDFTHTDKLYENIKNVTYHVTAPDSEGKYEWDKAGNLEQTYAIVGVHDDSELLEAITKINNGEANGIKLGSDVSYQETATDTRDRGLYMKNNCVFDLNEHTLTLKGYSGGDAGHIGEVQFYAPISTSTRLTITFKNGTILTDKSATSSGRALFSLGNTDLTFDSVTIEDTTPGERDDYLIAAPDGCNVIVKNNCIIKGATLVGSGGSLQASGATFNGSWYIIRSTFSPKEGVKITNCILDGESTDQIELSGGTAEITNCTIKVAMYLSTGAVFQITGGTVEGDVTFTNGTRADSFNATGTTFKGDRYIGAGEGYVRECVLTDCIFEGNLSIDVGTRDVRNITLSGCTIHGKLTATAQSRVKLTNGTSYESSEGSFTEE